MRQLIENYNGIIAEILVFAVGAVTYGLMEIFFRGYTHWSMVITGGACVLTFYLILDWLMAMSLFGAALTGMVIVTCYEFFVGLIVNVRFGMGVWDYSDMPGNVMGQICPAFSAVWFGLCLVFFAVIKSFS